MRRLLIAGNWKMNTTSETAVSLASSIAAEVPAENPNVEVLVAPPFPYLAAVREEIEGTGVQLGAQNCYFEAPGAFTGEVAVEMLLDVGCAYVILGHSERRHILKETNQEIHCKSKAALEKGLGVILCVGELLEEREAGRTEEVLDNQMAGGLGEFPEALLEDVVIAYEPVWAIGTGKTATPQQADSAHRHLRNWLEARYNAKVAGEMRILYGGSVKPDNAAELLGLANVDGALIGGASLKADSFLSIVRAAAALSKHDK